MEAGLAGTDGVVVGGTAYGVVSTETRAHQDTFPLESVAVLVLRTVRVQGTLFAALRILGVAALHAGDVGVDDALAVLAYEAPAAGPGGRALTSGNVNTSRSVVLDLAVLSGTALAQTAGVDTLAVLTGLLGRALTAATTSHSLDTAIVGVSHKARRTEFTDGLVVLHNAGSVAGTDLALTGVGALEVDAGLVPGTASVLQTDGD